MQADWQASWDGALALVAGRSLRCPMAEGSSGVHPTGPPPPRAVQAERPGQSCGDDGGAGSPPKLWGPNVLHFDDDAVPTEDEREATGRTAADTSRSTDGREENRTEDTTGPVYGSWGPGLSTAATSSTDHAVAVAPHTPPRFTGGGAAAKPKTSQGLI